ADCGLSAYACPTSLLNSLLARRHSSLWIAFRTLSTSCWSVSWLCPIARPAERQTNEQTIRIVRMETPTLLAVITAFCRLLLWAGKHKFHSAIHRSSCRCLAIGYRNTRAARFDFETAPFDSQRREIVGDRLGPTEREIIGIRPDVRMSFNTKLSIRVRCDHACKRVHLGLCSHMKSRKIWHKK